MANYYVIRIKFHWGFSYVTHYMKHSLLSTRRVISSIITRNFFVTRNKQPMTIGTNRMCISRDDNSTYAWWRQEFLGNIKARLGGDLRLRLVTVQTLGDISFAFSWKCLTGVLLMAVTIRQTWQSKSLGIVYRWKTKSYFPNGSQISGEPTRRLMSIQGYVVTILKPNASRKCLDPLVSA